MPNRWFVPLLVLATALLVPGAPAGAEPGGAMTLGASFGGSALMFEDDDLLLVNVPQGTSVFAHTPGLRLGHVSASRRFEFGFDAGVQYLNSDGSSAHVLAFGLDVERHFPGASAVDLFIGADVGFVSEDMFGEYTQPYVGAVIGGRNVIADDNGSVKLQLRYRRHFENDDVQGHHELNLALAFDLWIPH